MIKNLPVFKTIFQTVNFTLRNFIPLLRASAVWLVICIALNVLFEFLGLGEYFEKLSSFELLNAEMSKYNGVANAPTTAQEILNQLKFEIETLRVSLDGVLAAHKWGNRLLFILAFSSLSVAWVRLHLLDEKPESFRFGGFEARFLGYLLAYAAACVAVFDLIWYVFVDKGITTAGLVLLSILIVFGMVFVISRFLLVFPGVAVGDKRMNPLSSWKFTTRNSWDMYGGIWLVSLLSLLLFIAGGLLGASGSAIYISIPVQLLLFIISMSLYLGFLAKAYQYFVPRPEAGDLR